MGKGTERSHDQRPFDSRRTKRVSVITPRNPARAKDAPAPTNPEQDGKGESVPAASKSA